MKIFSVSPVYLWHKLYDSSVEYTSNLMLEGDSNLSLLVGISFIYRLCRSSGADTSCMRKV